MPNEAANEAHPANFHEQSDSRAELDAFSTPIFEAKDLPAQQHSFNISRRRQFTDVATEAIPHIPTIILEPPRDSDWERARLLGSVAASKFHKHRDQQTSSCPNRPTVFYTADGMLVIIDDSFDRQGFDSHHRYVSASGRPIYLRELRRSPSLSVDPILPL
ncbi:hypothetical protein M422DRAFT_264563 [Sphaerobolus stellatus SS14]|uniref:Uncharacterized protein n=1 Tax=Sphaerobolus stellatus (strain SS14) TaxID=990650 RepID=A0A0C9UFD4_SPHS4|nr:hypothetical protein M422DRAFT_264563 [Sphaerobolus stellatus SS14]